jgi:hypothetical protein
VRDNVTRFLAIIAYILKETARCVYLIPRELEFKKYRISGKGWDDV